jgi:hypothetical protein
LEQKEPIMSWYRYVAYFFSGAFLVNSVPHLINGLSGRRFPTPFASPPGKGESSPTINVLWGAINLVVGYLLVYHVGEFHLRTMQDALTLGIGGLVMAIMLSRAFEPIYGGAKGRT